MIVVGPLLRIAAVVAVVLASPRDDHKLTVDESSTPSTKIAAEYTTGTIFPPRIWRGPSTLYTTHVRDIPKAERDAISAVSTFASNDEPNSAANDSRVYLGSSLGLSTTAFSAHHVSLDTAPSTALVVSGVRSITWQIWKTNGVGLIPTYVYVPTTFHTFRAHNLTLSPTSARVTTSCHTNREQGSSNLPPDVFPTEPCSTYTFGSSTSDGVALGRTRTSTETTSNHSTFTPYLVTGTLGWSILSTTETLTYTQYNSNFPKTTKTRDVPSLTAANTFSTLTTYKSRAHTPALDLHRFQDAGV